MTIICGSLVAHTIMMSSNISRQKPHLIIKCYFWIVSTKLFVPVDDFVVFLQFCTWKFKFVLDFCLVSFKSGLFHEYFNGYFFTLFYSILLILLSNWVSFYNSVTHKILHFLFDYCKTNSIILPFYFNYTVATIQSKYP